MQTMELHKWGLTELQQEECVQVNGGNWIVKMILQEALRHVDEVVDGFKKGWNGEKP